MYFSFNNSIITDYIALNWSLFALNMCLSTNPNFQNRRVTILQLLNRYKGWALVEICSPSPAIMTYFIWVKNSLEVHVRKQHTIEQKRLPNLKRLGCIRLYILYFKHFCSLDLNIFLLQHKAIGIGHKFSLYIWFIHKYISTQKIWKWKAMSNISTV